MEVYFSSKSGGVSRTREEKSRIQSQRRHATPPPIRIQAWWKKKESYVSIPAGPLSEPNGRPDSLLEESYVRAIRQMKPCKQADFCHVSLEVDPHVGKRVWTCASCYRAFSQLLTVYWGNKPSGQGTPQRCPNRLGIPGSRIPSQFLGTHMPLMVVQREPIHICV